MSEYDIKARLDWGLAYSLTTPKLQKLLQDTRAAVEALEAERERLRIFAREVLDGYRTGVVGDIDGGWLEERALALGLLVPHESEDEGTYVQAPWLAAPHAAPAEETGQAQTECCGVPLAADERFCRKCGWEARVGPPAAEGCDHKWVARFDARENRYTSRSCIRCEKVESLPVVETDEKGAWSLADVGVTPQGPVGPPAAEGTPTVGRSKPEVGRCIRHGDGCRNIDCRDLGRWISAAEAAPREPQPPLDLAALDLAWAIERVEILAAANEADAGKLGPRVLKGHGYPNEIMSYAMDALALRTVLAALRTVQVAPKEQP